MPSPSINRTTWKLRFQVHFGFQASPTSYIDH